MNVRARATGSQTIVYGLEVAVGDEGVFVIDSMTGNITVGPNATSRLIIHDHNPTVFVFDAFAYYLESGPTNRVSAPNALSFLSFILAI